MNPRSNSHRRSLFPCRLLVVPACLIFASLQTSRAADGTWTLISSGNASGTWVDTTTANWSGGTVASGSGFTADFSTLDITANSTITLGAARTIGNLTFGDTSTTTAANWILAGSGSNILTLAGTTPTITVNTLSTNSTTITAAIAGSSGFTKAGTGRLILNGTHSSLTGAITVSAGTLDLYDTTSAYANDISLSTSSSVLDAANTGSNTTITVSGNITGAGKVTKTSGVSTLVLTGDNTYSGGTSLSAGTLVIGNGLNNSIGTGTLTLSSGAFRASDNASRTIANAISMGSSGLRFGGLQGDTTGLGDLNFTSTTSTSIGGSKTWTVNNSTTVTFANAWTGNSGWSVTKAGTGTLVFNGNLNSTGVGVIVSAGTFALNGAASSYTGTTTVNGGTLLINGAKTGTGTVAVNSTGTLAGSGTVGGAVTAASGSFLSAGASSGTAGTLTFSSTLDISGLAAGTGGLLFDLGATGSSDKISLTSGALSIGSGVLDWNDFSFSALGGYGAGTYTLFSTSTSIVGTMGSNLSGTIGGLSGALSISGNDIVLTVTAIPEPATYAMLAGITILGVAFWRRRPRA